MMANPKELLERSLSKVDWKGNIRAFLADLRIPEQMASANRRLAVWAQQLEMADEGNSALAFVREMQIAGGYVAVLTALAMYRPAASALRSAFEAALYYTYFRLHPAELATVTRVSGFYIAKEDLIAYHKLHTPEFKVREQEVGWISRQETWYKGVSGTIHGQVPGRWLKHRSIGQIAPVPEMAAEVAEEMTEGVALINELLLFSAAQELWGDFVPQARRELLAGLPGDLKVALRLSHV